MEMSKTYDPSEFESRLYKEWEEKVREWEYNRENWINSKYNW